jgi:hypothetical protein
MAALATKNRIAQNGHAPAPTKAERVELKPIDIRTFKLPIKGTSPLIVHKFSEKAKKQIEDKQQKKAKGAKEARDPKSEYLAACYVMPDSPKAGEKKAKYGVPASGLKNCAVSACKFVDGMPMTYARGAFHVIEDAGGLVEIAFDEMRMREDTVRLCGPGGALDMRYRPEFLGWSLVMTIRYNAAAISPEQIVNLFNIAGFSVGLCEWRPERDGAYGMFEVQQS